MDNIICSMTSRIFNRSLTPASEVDLAASSAVFSLLRASADVPLTAVASVSHFPALLVLEVGPRTFPPTPSPTLIHI